MRQAFYQPSTSKVPSICGDARRRHAPRHAAGVADPRLCGFTWRSACCSTREAAKKLMAEAATLGWLLRSR